MVSLTHPNPPWRATPRLPTFYDLNSPTAPTVGHPSSGRQWPTMLHDVPNMAPEASSLCSGRPRTRDPRRPIPSPPVPNFNHPRNTNTPLFLPLLPPTSLSPRHPQIPPRPRNPPKTPQVTATPDCFHSLNSADESALLLEQKQFKLVRCTRQEDRKDKKGGKDSCRPRAAHAAGDLTVSKEDKAVQAADAAHAAGHLNTASKKAASKQMWDPPPCLRHEVECSKAHAPLQPWG